MGVVYRAFDPKLGRAVALKVVRPVHDDSASDARARLIREARATLRVVVRTGVYVDTELPAGALDVTDATWAGHSLTADIPPDAIYVELELSVSDTGRAWIADLAIDG